MITVVSHSKTINQTINQSLIVESFVLKSQDQLEEIIFEEGVQTIPNIKSEPQTPNDYDENKLERSFPIPISMIKKEKVKVEQEKPVEVKPVIRLKRLEFYSTKLQTNSRYSLRPRKSSYIFSPFTSYIFTPRKKRNGFLKKKIFKTIKVEGLGMSKLRMTNQVKSCKVKLERVKLRANSRYNLRKKHNGFLKKKI